MFKVQRIVTPSSDKVFNELWKVERDYISYLPEVILEFVNNEIYIFYLTLMNINETF